MDESLAPLSFSFLNFIQVVCSKNLEAISNNEGRLKNISRLYDRSVLTHKIVVLKVT